MAALTFTYRQFDPPRALAPSLSGSFFAQGQIPYRFDKILPNGLVALVFNLGKPHRLGKSSDVLSNPIFAHNWLHGVQTTPVYNLPGGETHVLGMLFEPIGFHSLFHTDMRRLTDRTVDARDLLPTAFIDVVEAQYPDAGDSTAHEALHAALLSLTPLALPDWLWTVCTRIKQHDGMLRLDDLYRQIGASPRHISTKFKAATGVNPKVLSRVLRLQALLDVVDPNGDVSWTDLAHRFGFFDQAHFNRDFRTFSDLHPSQYLAERRRDLPDLKPGESVSFVPQR